VVSFTPRSLYPREKSPRYPLDRRLGGPQSRSDDVEKLFTLLWLELRPLGRPARSQSLYRHNVAWHSSNIRNFIPANSSQFLIVCRERNSSDIEKGAALSKWDALLTWGRRTVQGAGTTQWSSDQNYFHPKNLMQQKATIQLLFLSNIRKRHHKRIFERGSFPRTFSSVRGFRNKSRAAQVTCTWNSAVQLKHACVA
jgi:hypothetical protein